MNRISSRFFVLLTLTAAVCLCALTAVAGEAEEQARAIFQKNKDAVVTVQMVIKQRYSMSGMGSREHESKSEATGTVIDPDGLTVMALSSTDPTSIYQRMMSGMEDDVQFDSELSDIKLLLGKNKEVPARVVLRDNDLDLAFLRPIDKPAEPMAYVDMSEADAPKLLDQVVALNRLGRVADRTYSAAFERIEAIVERPRTFYLPGSDPTNTRQGSPAFTLDGKPVGIFVLRSIPDTDSGSGSIFGGQENIIPILLPAADILQGAQQAPGFDSASEEKE